MNVSGLPSMMDPTAFQQAMVRQRGEARAEKAAVSGPNVIPSGTAVSQASAYWAYLVPQRAVLGTMFDQYA